MSVIILPCPAFAACEAPVGLLERLLKLPTCCPMRKLSEPCSLTHNFIDLAVWVLGVLVRQLHTPALSDWVLQNLIVGRSSAPAG